MTNTAPEPVAAARAFREATGIRSGTGLAALREVAARRGWVVESRVVRGESGRAFLENGRWRIWLNSSEGVRRNRFTLSHEMGHALLGESGRHPQREESWCNAFASELLLPRLELLAALRYHGDRGLQQVRGIADRFVVTEACAVVAMNKVGGSPLAMLTFRRVGERWVLFSTFCLPPRFRNCVRAAADTGARIAVMPYGVVVGASMPVIVRGERVLLPVTAKRTGRHVLVAAERSAVMALLRGNEARLPDR